MSTALASAKGQKSKKEKETDKEKKVSAPPNERLKTVVRRLPPNLPEDIFWQSVQPWATEETVTWKAFYPGKLQKKLNKENVPSRAYIAFKNEEQLALFSREYDGHIFRDKTGAESQAVVEFAPYPKIPSEKRKPDNRNATIEKDEDYISFVESLKASENVEPVTLESLIASSQPPPPPKTTPLLEALKAEKSASRDKEAILRNHAHYNQINGGPSRKDEKKKAAPPTPAAKPAEAAAVTPFAGGGKKAGKKAQAQAAVSGPAVAQNAKNAAAQAPKDAPTGNPPANQGGKPAKPPRAPRPPPQAKQVAATVPPVIAVLPTQAAASTLSPATEGQTPTGAAVPPRRSRPVLGLGSRQFEAALSGVAGLASAATERKRREKEKEAQAQVQAQSAAAGPVASPSTSIAPPLPVPNIQYARIDASDIDKPASPASPPSPKKIRRGGRGGGGMGGPAASGSAEVPHVKVPSILQRADALPTGIIQKEALNATSAAPASVSTPVVVSPAGSNLRGGGGGGRRGKGGGRGRGGVPNAPRGG